jgi:hypothetical protein
MFAKRAAHHHFMIAAPRAVGVEIRRLHALRDQPYFPPGYRRQSIPQAKYDRW